MATTIGIDLTRSAHWRATAQDKTPHLDDRIPEFGWLGHLPSVLNAVDGARARFLEEAGPAWPEAGIDVLLLPVPRDEHDRRLSRAEQESLAAFVRAGGGLLLFGDSTRPGAPSAPTPVPLIDGLVFQDRFSQVKRPSPLGHLLTAEFDADPVPGHPATSGVVSVHVDKARAISGSHELRPLLVKSGEILAAAGTLGAGRVAVVSTGSLFAVPHLGRGSNARFLTNLIAWLAGDDEGARSSAAAEEIVHRQRHRTRTFAPEPDLERVPGGPCIDLARYADVLEDIAGSPLPDPYEDEDAFILEASLRFQELPRVLREAVIRFGRDSNDYGALLVKGLPVDPDLPATPADPRSAVHTDRKLSELWLAGFASAFGSPVAYMQEKSGLLYQNVTPTPHNAVKLSSESSAMLLDFHTETAFHPHMPDFVLLHCLRPDHDRVARTILSSVRSILPELSLGARAVLFEPLFRTGVDYSFGSENGTRGNGPVLPVLYGDPYDPQMTVDLDLMVGLTPEASEALAQLSEAVGKQTRWAALDRGDLLIIDNRRSVHGRSEFTARFDGRDRWLQRTCVVRDLGRSAADRRAGSRVLETSFAV